MIIATASMAENKKSVIYNCPGSINLNDKQVCKPMENGKRYNCTVKDQATNSSWTGEIYVGELGKKESQKPMTAKFFDIDTMRSFGCEVKVKVGGGSYYTTLKNAEVKSSKCHKKGKNAFECEVSD